MVIIFRVSYGLYLQSKSFINNLQSVFYQSNYKTNVLLQCWFLHQTITKSKRSVNHRPFVFNICIILVILQ